MKKEFKELNYCKKCVMPDTTEGANFKDGECMGCQAQKTKVDVNWEAKKKELIKILEEAKKGAGDNYDCIVPISGGKDSVYQLHVICKEFNMKPLAVTFNHGGFTKTGQYNLWNALKKFNIDHLQFTLNDNTIKKIQKRSIETIGDYCWHCHSMVNSITIQTAVNYGINLVIWGESGAEYGHQGATYNNVVKFDEKYFEKVSSKLTSEEFAKGDLTMRDLYPSKLPPVEKCKNIIGIHLGNYIPWNTEEQVKLIKKEYDWKEREVSGSYKKYKSIECSFEPIHEFLCYLKRAYARTSLQASQDIRDGNITRNEAFELVEKYERIEPKHLEYFLERVGMTPVEFREAVDKLKHEKVEAINLHTYTEWRNVEEDGAPFADRFIADKKGEL